ncbi:MAG: SEC-C metal-binding domain-containing protein, partial [Phycisphaerae bacterium]
ALSWIGWEEGQPIYHSRITKGIEKAQKKVEERNFEQRKSLLEYDEVMDYQRNVFYSRRKKILKGKGLKAIIEDMVASAITQNCQTILSPDYPKRCIGEWARTNFGVDLKPSDIANNSPEEIEQIIKEKAKETVTNEVSLSLGEYLEDYSDPNTWDVNGLCKWAMSAFKVSLSPSKVKYQSPEEIEEQLSIAAAEQVDKKDCSQLAQFLQEDFAAKMLTEWARAKFGIKLDPQELIKQKPEDVQKALIDKTKEYYLRREIEYPVEFAMSMVYNPQGANIYAFESLAEWVKKKYDTELSVEQIQNEKPSVLYKKLIELSSKYNNGELEREVTEKIQRLDVESLKNWANERFQAKLDEKVLSDRNLLTETLIASGREFLRKELSDLEKYVLLQVYDGTWKDHLYAMDHLKHSIWMRSMAEKDPKIEYKREGYRMFNEMLDTVQDRVTDVIFKVRLEAGTQARSVYQVSRTAHDEVGQFAMAERQRAAAQAPQGEVKVKQIKIEGPRVGRNDPCPCGSGKKYKKCCGANT